VCSGVGLPARAHRVNVHYDPAFAPPSHPASDMTALIAAALREWEAHSDGRIHWSGPYTVGGRRPAGPGNLSILWDPGLGSDKCGFASAYCPVWPHECFISINPNVPFLSARSVPPRGTVCEDMYSHLVHELTHHFNQRPCFDLRHCHPGDSAAGDSLAPGGAAAVLDDFSARHLWNFDMDNVNWTIYGQAPVKVFYDVFDHSLGGFSRSILATGNADEYFNFTHAIAPGTGVTPFMRSFVLGRFQSPEFGVVVDSGDLRTAAMAPRTSISGGFSRRKVCVAANAVMPHLVSVWSDAAEARMVISSPPTMDFLAGQRAVMFSESHDAGVTWSAAAAIPGAFTRNGVSCAFDQSQYHFVVAFEGAEDERIWTTYRRTDLRGPASWIDPRRIDEAVGAPSLQAFTPETPQLAITGSGVGIMTWFDVGSLVYKLEQLRYNPTISHYEFTNPPGTAHPRAAALSRTRPAVVPLQRGARVSMVWDLDSDSHRSATCVVEQQPPGTVVRNLCEPPTSEWRRHISAAATPIPTSSLVARHTFTP
jgi:hypothetical protein